MPDIVVQRKLETPLSTSGELSALWLPVSIYTLEPPAEVRIPAGEYRYEIRGTFVPIIIFTLRRLSLPADTPHILGIPGWDDNGPHGPVEIHPGNLPMQTEGCTLIGLANGPDRVWNSDAAFLLLMQWIPSQGLIQYIDIPIVSDPEIAI